MIDIKRSNVITAETVARLVQICEYNRKKDEHKFPGKVMLYFVAKARCDRCTRNTYKVRCIFMRENRYYPHKCIAYKETEVKS